MLRHAFVFERVTVTQYTIFAFLLPAFISYYVMAVLVQLPRTNFHRAALLPVVFWLSFRAIVFLDFSRNHPGYVCLNHGLASGLFGYAMRSTTWVFAQRPYSKTPRCKFGDGIANHENGNTPLEHKVSFPSALRNACGLLFNARGIGWIGPQKVPIPTPFPRGKSRSKFAFLCFRRFIYLVLVFDAVSKSIHLLGPDTFGTPGGGTVFDPSLPPLQRYLKSSIVTLLTGIGIYTAIDSEYHLLAALFTTLFWQDPSQWPPLFDSPWLSTSITSFWGRRWHQLFRECFVVVGGEAAQGYLGRAGVAMVSFTISAALHDVGVRAMGRDTDTLPVVGFFLMQGVGVAIECAWKRVTGRRVGGLVGWLWAFSWLLIWGHGLVDVWGRAGFIGCPFAPEAYRPSTLFLKWISEMK